MDMDNMEVMFLYLESPRQVGSLISHLTHLECVEMGNLYLFCMFWKLLAVLNEFITAS